MMFPEKSHIEAKTQALKVHAESTGALSSDKHLEIDLIANRPISPSHVAPEDCKRRVCLALSTFE